MAATTPLLLVTLGLGGLVLAGCGGAPPPPAPAPIAIVKPSVDAPLEAAARALAEDLAAHRFDAARARFSDSLQKQISVADLGGVLDEIAAASGPFAAIDGAQPLRIGAQRNVRVLLRFARGRQSIRVVFDDQDRIGGLWIEPVTEDLDASVRAAIGALAAKDFPRAEASFHEKMRAALPPADLAKRWAELGDKLGAFQDIEGLVPSREPSYWLVVANCRFEKSRVGLRFVFDLHGRAVGFFVVDPAVPATAWEPPSYVDTAKIEERRVVVGATPALPGALVLPKGGSNLPVVVLVHGSGPGDMDESNSLNRANRMFKDLAWGLASRGVAVLRHDKRTKVAPDGVVTVEQEYVDSVRAAVELVKKTPELDARKIVVLGHSQGGTLAPRIAKEVPGVAAIAILAGATRGLPDSMIMQLTYFMKLHPDEPGLADELAKAKRLKATVEDPLLPRDKVIEGAGGVTGAYFIDLRGYDPVRAAAALSIPMLVLQGERDYQVTVDEFDAWRAALSSNKRARLKQYPALNHLFMPGSGTPGPQEYAATNHVAPEVVADLAEFVLRLR